MVCVILIKSRINIAGRLFVTNPVQDFKCFTIQAYKPVTSDHYTYNGSSVLDIVEAVDPNYKRLPWADKEASWAATLLLGPFLGAYVVCFNSITIRWELYMSLLTQNLLQSVYH